jgi:phosphoribosylformylglycinamidine synthase subunit PurS
MLRGGRKAPGAFREQEGAMKARVTVTLKSGVLDPQGKAIEGALKSLGVAGIASVRQGRVFDIELEAADAAKAEATLREAAEKLLANTVIENFQVEVAAAEAPQ